MRVEHGFGPVWDEHSRILILGSMPSVKSREQRFYYGHPQNRFWKVLAAVTKAAVPETVAQKQAFLLEQRIALWDVIASCEIQGSSDSSIREAQANDVAWLLRESGITRVYVNGGKAAQLYDKLLLPKTELAAVRLPSTSPANAAWSLPRLVDAWRVIAQ
ncbi:MAG: DNA-deoxyinosine glycosylase [Lachnospiraceae bacterium]|nr:DNA-deoxyinosine glycosylase [Lachnospiraceae bacterium]